MSVPLRNNNNHTSMGTKLYQLFQLWVMCIMILHIYMEEMNYSLLLSSSSSWIEQGKIDELAILPLSLSSSSSLSSSTIETKKSSSLLSSLSLPVISMLEIPQGNATALPSMRNTEEGVQSIDRKFYGGKGDKPHLGGFTEYDGMGVSPTVWKWMVQYLGVKTLLDVGCGRGISTSWFVTHGVDTYCVEGSHDAVQQTIMSDPTRVIEHDFSRGPWWPPTTVDAVWCVEFLEHVGRQFHQNYIPAFRKAAVVLVTNSLWGGWHHVEVHESEWWIQKFEMYGFRYSDTLSQKIRQLAKNESIGEVPTGPDGEALYAQHIFMNMKAFINPAVASLPQHQHLLAEHGCFGGGGAAYGTKTTIHRKCGTDAAPGKKMHSNEETPLPESYHAILLTPEMDQIWTDLIKKNIDISKIPK